MQLNVLDRGSKTPLYEQLKDQLVRQIENRHFQEGSHFYSLAEIADNYQVSLITVRRVISEMAAEGYLELAAGKKSLVAHRRENAAPRELTRVAVFFYSNTPEDGRMEYDKMPWTNLVFSGIQEKFFQKNILCTTIPARNEADALDKFSHIIDDHQGIICMNNLIFNALESELRERQLPYVLIQPKSFSYGFNYVAADHFAGSAEIARMALEKKYRSFLYLSSQLAENPEKLRGFQETLLRHHIAPQDIYLRSTSDIHEASGEEALKAFLQEKSGTEIFPLAIYTSGDRLAHGVLEGCHRLGIRVPQQIGVAGSTGIPEVTRMEPALTGIELPMREMGHAAVDMICEMFESGQHLVPGRILKTTLIVRNSL